MRTGYVHTLVSHELFTITVMADDGRTRPRVSKAEAQNPPSTQTIAFHRAFLAVGGLGEVARPPCRGERVALGWLSRHIPPCQLPSHAGSSCAPTTLLGEQGGSPWPADSRFLDSTKYNCEDQSASREICSTFTS